MRWIPLLLIALACASAGANESASSPQEVELSIGERVTARGLTVDFVRLVGDSRCPEGVNCVWAGDAEIELSVKGKDEPRSVRLHTTLEPKALEVEGSRISLLAVEPYPVMGVEVDPAEIRARLEIGPATGDAGTGAE